MKHFWPGASKPGSPVPPPPYAVQYETRKARKILKLLLMNGCREQPMMRQANMLGCKSGVVAQITNIQPKASATHCHAYSSSLTEKVLTRMHSSYGDNVDVTALKSELLAFQQTSKENVNHFDDIISETISDTRLLFPTVIIVIQLLLVNPAIHATLERSFSISRPGYEQP